MTFEEAYRAGSPPWDIGRPQPEVVRLLVEGRVVGPVLDVGCGTGETALACAARGLEVVGVDSAPTAIARARDKAAARGLSARFELRDAKELATLGPSFATAIDVGLFHVFDDVERPLYVQSLAGALRADGRAFVLCFSDAEPDWGGPRRVRAEEIAPAFEPWFEVRELRRATFETATGRGVAEAWRIDLGRRSG